MAEMRTDSFVEMTKVVLFSYPDTHITCLVDDDERHGMLRFNTVCIPIQ